MSKNTRQLLEPGTLVHVQLKVPVNRNNEMIRTEAFKATDIRWSREKYKIERQQSGYWSP